MSTVTKPRATYADIEALPPDVVVGEIIGGELVVSPRPAPRHAIAASALGNLIGSPFALGTGGPGGWWIIDEPELHLGIDPDYEVLVPDLAGWRRERMPEPPSTAWFSLPPDWVCEVISPRNAARDRSQKMPFYARAGISHAWLLDPAVCTLEAFRLHDGAWRVIGTLAGEARVRIEPFEAIELDLTPLWAGRRAQ